MSLGLEGANRVDMSLNLKTAINNCTKNEDRNDSTSSEVNKQLSRNLERVHTPD